MAISSLASTYSSSLYGSSSEASAASNAVAQALTTADARVQEQQSQTTAQLSSFGLLQSALSEAQTSSQAMGNLSTSSSSSDVTNAMATFFNDYNSVITSAAKTAAMPGNTTAQQSATRVASDTKMALMCDPNAIDAMNTLGITIQSDGTMTQNASTFAAALKNNPSGAISAMATLGADINTAATNELGSSGAVKTAMTSLNSQSTVLATQVQALESLEPQLGVSDPLLSAATTGSTSGTSTGSTASSTAGSATGTTSASTLASELSSDPLLAESSLIDSGNSDSASTNSTISDMGLAAYQSNSSY